MAHPSIEKARALLAQREQREAEYDQWLIRRAQREADGIFDEPPVRTYEPEPQQREHRLTDAEHTAVLRHWVAEHVRAALAQFAAIMGDETGMAQKKADDANAVEFAALRGELQTLRTRVDEMQAQLDERGSNSVARLVRNG
jgi:hypothetical protein